MQHVIGRDVRVKYGSSLRGYFWSVPEPVMLAAVYFFVFSIIARFNIENYALFLVCALMPWYWVKAVVGASTKALVGQSRLITKVNVPRAIFPLGVVGAKTFEFFDEAARRARLRGGVAGRAGALPGARPARDPDAAHPARRSGPVPVVGHRAAARRRAAHPRGPSRCRPAGLASSSSSTGDARRGCATCSSTVAAICRRTPSGAGA